MFFISTPAIDLNFTTQQQQVYAASSIKVAYEAEGHNLASNNLATKLQEQAETSLTNRAFITAASYGHTDTLKLLLAHGDYRALVNEALLHATNKGHLATVVLLLNNGADINTTTLKIATIDNFDAGTTPLMLAACNGHKELVNLLLDKGASLERTTSYGDTALTKAAAYGHAAIVKTLLDRGANIAHTNNLNAENALVLATASGSYPTVELLTTRGNYTLEHNRAHIEKALINATQGRFIDIVKYLVKLYNYDNINKLIPIAAYNYDTEMMQFLFDQGGDINKGIEAVILANEGGCNEKIHVQYEQSVINVLQWFIDHGAKFPLAQLHKAFWWAVENGQVELVNFLINQGVDINSLCANEKTMLANALEIANKLKNKGIYHKAMFTRLNALAKINRE